MKGFTAKYAGTCVTCGKYFGIGDKITWSRKAKRSYSHAACSSALGQALGQNETQVPTAAVQTTKTESDAVLDVLASALLARFPSIETGVDEEKVREIVRDEIPDYTLVRLETPEGKEVAIDGPQHSRLPELLYYVGRRENVYLFGPSQAGKSTAASVVAKGLGLPFYYVSLNPQTPDSRLMGFVGPNGNPAKTAFANAYENGGVFCIDEVDNASGSLLTTINSALGNGCAAFPWGMVERHKDCVIVATGNTPGLGGTPEYPERRVLDSAFRERFRFVSWGYDESLEEALVLARNPKARPILTWVRKVRAFAKTKGLRLLATPTCSMALADYAKAGTITLDAALDAVLFKGIDEGTRAQVLAGNATESLRNIWGAKGIDEGTRAQVAGNATEYGLRNIWGVK